MKILASALTLLCLYVVPATAHDGTAHKHGLTIEGAWAPHTGKRTMSAAVYMVIKNQGDKADALVSLETPAAENSMLHESKEVDGVMQMEHVHALSIPAGGMAELAPGGHHVMLMRLAKPLKRGEVFPLTLTFEEAGDVTIMVEITGIGGPKK